MQVRPVIVWPCPLRVPVKAVASLAFSSSSSPGVRVPMGAKFAIPGRSMSAVRTKFSSRFPRMAESCYTVSICQGSPTVPLPLHSVKSLPHRPGQNTGVPSAACLQTEVTLQAYCCALFSFAASSQWMRSDLYLSRRESFQHAFRLFSSSLPRLLAAAAREFPRIRVLVPRHRGGARPKGTHQRHSQISPFPCHPATASSGMVRAPVIQSLQ